MVDDSNYKFIQTHLKPQMTFSFIKLFKHFKKL